jgi:hypothetical protein
MSLFGPDMTDDFVKFNNFRVSTVLKHFFKVTLILLVLIFKSVIL